MKYGFSLVELSIVLVILGLLTGGILSGQSLIRAAELRAVVNEYQRNTSAINTFRDKYMAIPGDFKDATKFWGKDTAACAAHTGTAATPGTCNGNGNGLIVGGGGGSQHGEMFQAWKQLALAGVIEGSYTGLSGSTGAYHTILGENAPQSKIANTGWSLYSMGVSGGASIYFAMDYGNAITYGHVHSNGGVIGYTTSPFMKAEEAWNIDTKIDDGKPAYGKLIATTIFGPLSSIDPCVTANSGAMVNTNYDMSYNVSSSISQCGFIFRHQY